MAYRGDRGGGRGDRGAFRGGDRGGGDRGGRGGGRGADRGGDRGGDRGAYRGGGGDRGTYRGGGGGDGGFRGGDRGGRGGRGGGFGGPPAPALGFAYPQSSEIDSRLSGPEQDVLVNRFKSLTVQDTAAISFPLRPGWGTSGTPIKLRANFFAMKTFPDTLYEYDVKISPDPKARRLKKRILDLLLLTPEFVAYSKFVAHDSGAKLIAARAIQLSNPEINVLFVDEDEDEAKEGAKAYKVTVNFTQEVDVASLKL
jgi:eukaryotic translation initiation factor 2C